MSATLSETLRVRSVCTIPIKYHTWRRRGLGGSNRSDLICYSLNPGTGEPSCTTVCERGGGGANSIRSDLTARREQSLSRGSRFPSRSSRPARTRLHIGLDEHEDPMHVSYTPAAAPEPLHPTYNYTHADAPLVAIIVITSTPTPAPAASPTQPQPYLP